MQRPLSLELDLRLAAEALTCGNDGDEPRFRLEEMTGSVERRFRQLRRRGDEEVRNARSTANYQQFNCDNLDSGDHRLTPSLFFFFLLFAYPGVQLIWTRQIHVQSRWSAAIEDETGNQQRKQGIGGHG